jgi:hypothetical protein
MGTTFGFAGSIGKRKPFTLMVGLPTVRITEDTGRYVARAVANGKPATTMAIAIRTRQTERRILVYTAQSSEADGK